MQRLRPVRTVGRRKSRRDDGFTIIEMMVALSILVIIIAASASALSSSLRIANSTKLQSTAASLLESITEQLRTSALKVAGFNAIPVTRESLPAQTVGSATFYVTQTAEWVASGTTSSVCTSGTSTSLVLHVTESATWNGSLGPVTTSTIIAPPAGTFSPSNGALAITVLNSAGGYFSGATVNVTSGGTSQSITTSSDGCAFFASLPAGTYAGSVTSGVTGVDSFERSPGALSGLSVNQGQTTAQTINFDIGGTVSYTESSSAVLASNMPVSLGNSSMSWTDGLIAQGVPAGTTSTPPTATSVSGTLSPIYPASYYVFAGSCSDANPLGTYGATNTYFYPGAVGPSATVTSGSVSSVTLALTTLSLKATYAAVPVANATVTAVAGANGTTYGGACVSTAPTYGLAATTAGGMSATAVGLGHLAITVSGTVNGVQRTGTAYLWVQPTGIYQYIPSTGAATGSALTGSIPVVMS